MFCGRACAPRAGQAANVQVRRGEVRELRRACLYNSANTKRYVAEALAVSGLAASGAAVWLYLRGDNRERDATTDASVHVVPTATGLALSGQF